MDAETAKLFKQAGMARVVSLARPDLKQVLVIYPDAKSLLRMPMSDEAALLSASAPKVEKTVLGSETIDGRSCQKTKVVFTEKGKSTEAVAWFAKDMQDFPVQIQSGEGGNKNTIRFSEVTLKAPEANLFEVPRGYKEFKDTEEMMAALVQGATK
jgi:hypothetical protein